MSWENKLKKNYSTDIREFIKEAYLHHNQVISAYAKLDTTISQEDKQMLQAELSDIATMLLDLPKAIGELGRALERQEKLQ
tara:strand:- start:389 stop:631 length:243 start_codon:yes stop_codon:yes gene_type:complete